MIPRPGTLGTSPCQADGTQALAHVEPLKALLRCVQIEDAVAVVVLHRASLQERSTWPSIRLERIMWLGPTPCWGLRVALNRTAEALREEFAPSLRDMQEETAACHLELVERVELRASMSGLHEAAGKDVSPKAFKELIGSWLTC